MSDDLVLAARAAQELHEPVRQLASVLGRSRLSSEVMDILVHNVRYRSAPHKAKLVARAAKKITDSGLPLHAVEDRILIAVLEHGGFDSDPDMQERWSSLLANAATGCSVPPAFPEILRQMETTEARFLDRLFDADELSELGDIPGHEELQPRHLDNLQRLGVLSHDGCFLPYGLSDHPADTTSVDITPLGTSLVIACRAPDPFRIPSR